MNEEKKVVLAFMHLLQQQPQLFSEEQRAQLEELLKKQANFSELSNAIKMWCKLYPHINKQLTDAIKQIMIASASTVAGCAPSGDYSHMSGVVGFIPIPSFIMGLALRGALRGAGIAGGGGDPPSQEELEKLRGELINIIRVPRK